MDVSAPASVAFDELLVSVFSSHKALKLEQSIATTTPGRVVIDVPGVDDTLRVGVTAREVGTVTARGGDSAAVRKQRQTRVAIALASEVMDRDNDGVPDKIDNCPDVANPTQDSTTGGSGDACAMFDDLGGSDGATDLSVGDLSPPDLVPPVDLATNDLLTITQGPRLFAVHPERARTGETIYLEGRFGATVDVIFPRTGSGTVSATATVLGGGRAKVQVPAEAGAGDLFVYTDGVMSNSVRFRRLPYNVKIGAFNNRYEQLDVARRFPQLGSARVEHRVWASRDWLYVFGGWNGASVVGSIERARINYDGTIGDFSSAGNLTTPRAGAMLIELAGYVYLMGGTDTTMALDTIERAPINANGTLGAFTAITTKLEAPRVRGDAVIAGQFVYVTGGIDPRGVDIGRAPIAMDGSLGTFTTAGSLPSVMIDHHAMTIGNYVTLFSSLGAGSYIRAPIGVDGTLGSWEFGGGTKPVYEGATVFELGTWLWTVGGNDTPTDMGAPLDRVQKAAIGVDGMLGTLAGQGGVLQPSIQRTQHVIIGNHLYLIGGEQPGTSTPVATIQRATIQDANHGTGGIAQFVAAPSQLSATRVNFRMVVIADKVYLIGGFDRDWAALASVEVATIAADGTVGPFAASGPLTVERAGPALALVGRRLYVIGGLGLGGLTKTSIESAVIEDDGTISPFELVDARELATSRMEATAFVLGNRLYVLGGQDANLPDADRYLRTIDSAPLDGDLLSTSFAAETIQLPFGRSLAVTLGLASRLIVLGGFPDQAYSMSHQSGVVEAVEIPLAGETLGTPVTLSTQTEGLIRPYALVGDEVMGMGAVYNDGAQSTTLASDGTLGPMEHTTRFMPTGLWYHCTTVLGNFFYTLGGTDNPSQASMNLINVRQAELQ